MSQRGSRISRTIEYFKSAEIEEARIVWTRVNEIMTERLGPPKPKRARTRHKAIPDSRLSTAGQYVSSSLSEAPRIRKAEDIPHGSTYHTSIGGE